MNRMIVFFFVIVLLMTGCSDSWNESVRDNGQDSQKPAAGQWAPGEEEEDNEDEEDEDYELKIIDMDKQEAESAADRLFSYMRKCSGVYKRAVKADEEDLDEEVLHEMINIGERAELSVTCGNRDYNLTNYKKVDAALKQAGTGAEVETEFYQVNSVGIFRYYRLLFKKKELFVTTISALYDESAEPVLQQMEKIQVYRWEYTEKGWLIWEKALSRNQEMDMHIFCRILPLDETCREITDRCIVPVSYLSNNLFLEDWDVSTMDRIEFNDLFDYLYLMTTGSRIEAADYPDGIPGEEFEAVTRRFFDITQEELRSYAGYDAASARYPWSPVGVRNRVQQVQPSFPEVVKCVENEDGTISAYVEAVFIEEGTDRAFSHVVTLRRSGDGFVYLGNKVDRENALLIPGYRPRREYEEQK